MSILNQNQTASAAPVIQAREVAKSFGDTQVLSDITVDIPAGVTGLLGSNGAGKTTLITLLLGVEKRDGGDLTVLGADPATSGPEVRSVIGYSPEHHHLPADFQALEMVTHLCQLHGLDARTALQRASDALWLVGLGEERFRAIGTMSTGQRQRVKLAAAISHDPELVILDEPTDGLDPVQRDDVLALIDRIGHDFGMSVLLSSHLLGEVEKVCDNVIMLADGVVRRSGSLQELKRGSGGLSIVLKDHHDKVAAHLNSIGLKTRRQSERLYVQAQVSDDRVMNAIRDTIAAYSASIVRLEEQTISLEEVFLTSGIGDPTGTHKDRTTAQALGAQL